MALPKGIQKLLAGANVTITDPVGPTSTIAASGGGGIPSVYTQFNSGRWYPGSSNVNVYAAVQAEAWARPIYIPTSHTFTAIGVGVNLAAAAGGVVRLGLYADNGSGYPGALVTDYGTVSVAASGLASISITEALTAGNLYWLCAAFQGSPATQALMYFDDGALSPIGGSTPYYAAGTGASLSPFPVTYGGLSSGYGISGVAGALPNPFTVGGSPDIAPAVMLAA